MPAATPFWAKLAVLSAGGTIELAWYTAVSFVLSFGPMRAGYHNVGRTVDRVTGTLLIAGGRARCPLSWSCSSAATSRSNCSLRTR